MVKIALVQMACGADAEDNTNRALAAVAEAARNGAELVCLPELFQHEYFPVQQKHDDSAYALAEPIDGAIVQRLAQAARENKVWLIGGSIYERAEDGYYNTAPVFDDTGKLVTAYRKCHIPQDPGFYEKDYFKEGDRLPEVIEATFGKFSLGICFDQWFPEFARIMAAEKGAQILFYPTAIGMPDNIDNITGDWRQMWQNAQLGHAASNNIYVAVANRIGRETAPDGSETTEFFGGSFIADYASKKVAEADMESTILYADCDLARQKEVQEAWCFLPNRRKDLYGDVAKSGHVQSVVPRAASGGKAL